MSDVQENEAPEPIDEAAVNATVVSVEAVMPPADLGHSLGVDDPGHHHGISTAFEPSTHFAYVREELLAVVFGIKSGVNNGVERAESLIRHIESLL